MSTEPDALRAIQNLCASLKGHRFGDWIQDEDDESKKHRSCTICFFEQTLILSSGESRTGPDSDIS